jgi:hypothetical protein
MDFQLIRNFIGEKIRQKSSSSVKRASFFADKTIKSVMKVLKIHSRLGQNGTHLATKPGSI